MLAPDAAGAFTGIRVVDRGIKHVNEWAPSIKETGDGLDLAGKSGEVADGDEIEGAELGGQGVDILHAGSKDFGLDPIGGDGKGGTDPVNGFPDLAFGDGEVNTQDGPGK